VPSARSIAFRREVFEAGGGYPEWLEVGEDMYLNHRMLAGGAHMERALDAVAYWRVRPTIAATWRQYARYAEGDAVAGMYPERHLLRVGTYAALVVVLRTRRAPLLVAAAAAGLVHARAPLRRVWRGLPAGSPRRLAGAALT